MAAVLVDDVEFALDGDIVRMRTRSGTEWKDHGIPIATFERNHLKAEAVIALWHSRRCEVVPIASVPRLGMRKRDH